MKQTIFRSLCSILLACLVSAQAYAAEKPPQTLDDLKATIERIRLETRTPAVGLALVNQDGPLWVAGLGEANLETHVRADENTMFRSGSASKMFVGLSILKLVEQGKLKLDDNLRDIAPEVPFHNPWEASHPVRIAHLLEHTTGWDIRPSEYGVEAPDTMPLLEGLSDPMRTLARTSRWAPGSRHAYNNSGPVVAAYVVEKLTRQRYEDFVQDTFFKPLRMDSSTYFRSGKYLAQGATLYVGNQPQTYAQMYSRPASSLNTSAKDMAQLLQMFIQGGQSNGIAVIKPESILQMQTSHTTLGAEYGVRASYGLTMELAAHKNYAMVGHSGVLPGALTQFSYSPELHKGFVLMLNASNGDAQWQMSKAIQDFLFQEPRKPLPKPIPLPSQFQQLDGIYSPVNPSVGMMKLMSDVTEAITLSHSADYLRRTPLFGGESTDDFAVNDRHLISPNTGLPTTAIANDPVIGQIVQIGRTTYQRVPAIQVYARLALLLSVAVLSVGSILFALIWIPRRIWGTLPAGAGIQVRIWPLLTTLTLVLLPVAPMVFGSEILDFARFSPTSVSVFLLSLLYPVLALFGLVVTVKYRATAVNPWVRWTSGALAVSHAGFAVLLASYGLLGLRLWA